jgi:pyridoxal phosphate enzyme (YggS family)
VRRRAEIADNLHRVRGRIAAACSAHGRTDDVTLIAVTKTYPAADVLHLAALGVVDVGENRDQEASGKVAETAAAGADVRWHHIGQLQRNKCRSVASYASMVHSVDRLPLVAALDRARAESADPAPLDVLIQLNLDGRPDRGGADLRDVAGIADAVAATSTLRLAGVMAVAPLDAAGADLEAAFETVARESAALRRSYPEATVISAGMSADFELAIAYGATHVRVGSLLLGTRPPLR